MKSKGNGARGAEGGVSRRAVAGALAAGIAIGASQVARAEAPGAAAARPATGTGAGTGRKLSFGLTKNLQTEPVIEGRVSSPAIDPTVTTVYGTDLFGRQLRDAEFDAAEMSISSLMMGASRGDRRFVGVPVFTTRGFFHTYTLVRRDAGIHSPSDLKGKRVGVPEYQQTAALWTRGVLQDEFGVGLEDMEFWMERLPGVSHASALGFKPPSYVRQIPPEKSIGSMVLSGELDAALLYIRTNNPQPSGDRSTEDLEGSPLVRRLFPDPWAEGVRYFKKTGFHHINHGMVLRRSLAERDPSLPAAIVGLFNQASAAVDAERLAHIAYHHDEGLVDEASYKALSRPIVRHGVEPNRRLLETMARYSYEQGLSTRLMSLDEIFPGT